MQVTTADSVIPTARFIPQSEPSFAFYLKFNCFLCFLEHTLALTCSKAKTHVRLSHELSIIIYGFKKPLKRVLGVRIDANSAQFLTNTQLNNTHLLPLIHHS